MMLSEVHPLAYLRLHKAKAEYLPTDIVQQLSLTHNNLDPALCIAAWQGSIHSLHQAINEQNKHLILRSHSHVDFFFDIETAKDEQGYSTPEDTRTEITSIAYYDKIGKDRRVLVLDKQNRLSKSVINGDN